MFATSKIGGLQKVGALNIHHPILGALNIQSTFLEPIFWELFEYPSSKKVAFVKKAASREQLLQQQQRNRVAEGTGEIITA